MKLISFSLVALVAVFLTGCEWMPGHPKKADKRPEPHDITSFETLYHQNCRGCHGGEGSGAAVLPLDNELYLSILPKERLREIITRGIPKTSMPGFLIEEGGTLTEKQVEILTNGIYAWSKGAAAPGTPPYTGPLGDAARGGEIIAQHGAAFMNTKVDGGPYGWATGLGNPAFVGQVSDQYLRTLVIVGRPDLGFADYRTRIPGQVMTDQDINDVVAWLVAQRKNEFGQPLVPAATPQP